MNPIVQLALAVIPGLVAAAFAFFQATKTAKLNTATNENIAAQNAAIERAKLDLERVRIDADAYNRAKSTYEQLLTEMRNELDRVRRQVDRMQEQADRLSDQLAKEQDVSHTLRQQHIIQAQQITQLRHQVATLEQLLNALGTGEYPGRTGIRPPVPPLPPVSVEPTPPPPRAERVPPPSREPPAEPPAGARDTPARQPDAG